ncbi:dTDP-4-dehydrorhamnose reductase [Pelagibacterales bacterium]|nr:dTDP-4-dehydrorhamnose reductase [Pelagibacterales bacterium]
MDLIKNGLTSIINKKFMKILLTGKNGQVGFELYNSLSILGEVLVVGTNDCDLSDTLAIRKLLQNYKPDIIVNAAAYTSVDKAEIEKLNAIAINENAPRVLAEEAERLGSLLIHFSTDYVFDGTKQGAYMEDDQTSPLSTYGSTKLAGEIAIQKNCKKHLIFRTSWVFGLHGNNFAKKILQIASKRDTLHVVNDQFGAPTSARLLANVTANLVQQYIQKSNGFPFGLYHLTASGKTNWYEYACYLIEKSRNIEKVINVNPVSIIPISSSEKTTGAKRPVNSILDTNKIQRVFSLSLPSWQEGLDHILSGIYNE